MGTFNFIMAFALELKYYELCSFEFPMWSKTKRLLANNFSNIKTEKLNPHIKFPKVGGVYCALCLSCKTNRTFFQHLILPLRKVCIFFII